MLLLPPPTHIPSIKSDTGINTMSLSTKLKNLNILVHGWSDYCLYKADFVRAHIHNKSKYLTILTYPEKPHMCHQLSIMCHRQGYTISNDPQSYFDIAIAFADTTIRANDPVLHDLAAKHPVVNIHCNDISKTHLENVFSEIFGYGMAVDPRNYQGAYVQKSDANAQHDGKILHTPTKPEAGYVYQKLINNKCGADTVLDIRIGVCKEDISFALKKYRSIHDRFDNTNQIEIVDADAVLSIQEQADIIRFCKAFGLDYGELDILRDADDGKIYIVDVNNTPASPLRGIQMTKKDHDLLIDSLSQSFASAFLHQKESSV